MGKIDSIKDAALSSGGGLVQSLQSIAWAFLLSFVGITVAALLFTYTSLKDQYQSIVSLIIMALSVFSGGCINGKKAAKKGWLHGGIIGLLYTLIVLIISSLFSKTFSMDAALGTTACISVISGMAGGIIGVNMKR